MSFISPHNLMKSWGWGGASHENDPFGSFMSRQQNQQTPWLAGNSQQLNANSGAYHTPSQIGVIPNPQPTMPVPQTPTNNGAINQIPMYGGSPAPAGLGVNFMQPPATPIPPTMLNGGAPPFINPPQMPAQQQSTLQQQPQQQPSAGSPNPFSPNPVRRTYTGTVVTPPGQSPFTAGIR